uniref:Asparagine-rich antigen Pfa35-2 n=2 Tax=Schistosoma japonicum TaxID=6182 RepID=C1L7C3_SCHJA|nr:asparagine-rich antigen Pfa35-2 [Schistosoma japonicum]CAX70602.1 asparagine-rich antigen Pfa35-2 [Schistosoma japonicum]
MRFICLHIFAFITFICSNKADKFPTKNILTESYNDDYKGLYNEKHHDRKDPQDYWKPNHEDKKNYESNGYGENGNKYVDEGHGKDSYPGYPSSPHETYKPNKRDDKRKYDVHSYDDHYDYFKDFDKHLYGDNHNNQPSHDKYPEKTYQNSDEPHTDDYDGNQIKPEYNNYQNEYNEHYQPQQNDYYTNSGYGSEGDYYYV